MNQNPKFIEYRCRADLNVYDSPSCNRLATQADLGRHLRVVSRNGDKSVEVCLLEDDYPGWLSIADLSQLEEATTPYRAIDLSIAEISDRLPAVIAFTQNAMKQPNYYLWGGTLGPNYDCSGLMQAAFAASGIWLPRDAYQQEAFTQVIPIEELLPGDLIFFGSQEKATHVGLYLGNGSYIHSSGENMGRNGIGIDVLSEQGDAVSQSYYRQLRRFGRVVKSYQPLVD
ncbi:C40 family peptidase [Argonema antarcticum]|uniref:C40 family peptidase n=1 Tax=Argonema antarcticum TaxID=2942763 RepID=UPI00201253FA|nr:C40 family peptidase [Argonema antarcticum]MCL1474534.1 C40 family peptidase [Argonema antarcticum A004/B2]